MQFRKSEQGFGITDVRTAVVAAILGAFLVLTGVAIVTAGIIRAGEASGSAVVETVLFGIIAAVSGAWLCRTGLRAARRIRTARPIADTRDEDASELDRAA